MASKCFYDGIRHFRIRRGSRGGEREDEDEDEAERPKNAVLYEIAHNVRATSEGARGPSSAREEFFEGVSIPDGRRERGRDQEAVNI